MRLKFKKRLIFSFLGIFSIFSFLLVGCVNNEIKNLKIENIDKKYKKDFYINSEEKLEIQKIRESMLKSNYYFEKFANAEVDFLNFFKPTEKQKNAVTNDYSDHSYIGITIPKSINNRLLKQEEEKENWFKKVDENPNLLNNMQFILESQDNVFLVDEEIQNILWTKAKNFFNDKNFKRDFFIFSITNYKKILYFEYDIFETNDSFLKYAIINEPLFYENAPKIIKNNQNYIVSYLSSKKSDFNKIPENFKTFPDLVLLALEKEKTVPKDLITLYFKDNNEILKRAFLNNIIKYDDLNEFLKKDKEICIQAINESLEYWSLIPDDLKKDDDITYLYVLKSGGDIHWVDNKFFKNDILLEKIVVEMPWIFYKIPSQYQNNLKIIKSITNFLDYKLLPKETRHNIDVIIHFVNSGKFGNNYSNLPLNIKSDYTLIKTVIKNNPEEFKNIPKQVLDDENIKNLIYINPEIVKFLPDDYKNNKELMLLSIKINHDVFRYISDDLKRNSEFFKIALKKSPKNIKYMPEDMIYKKSFLFKYVWDNDALLANWIIWTIQKEKQEEDKKNFNYSDFSNLS